MMLLLCAVALLIGGGCIAFCAGRGPTANRIGSLSAACGSALALIPPLSLLFGSAAGGTAPAWTITLGSLPLGVFALSMDAFSAIFLAPVLLLSSLCALYGGSSLISRANTRHLGAHWLFYNLLVTGMVLALTAADAFLFLLAWELLSVTPFFLICLNDDTQQVRSAAWVYLVAAHLGVLFLLAFFACISARSGGSLSFQAFIVSGAGGASVVSSSLLFILALVGFGAKIGLLPLHVWLPEAYPAAPSHISALMAGAAINIGIYGLVRALSFIGPGETWWACLLIGIGAFTGFVGILFALAQPDIKRSLAYSSVENMGIICMALGIGLLCLQQGHTGPAYLALTGAMMHMVNHALSKGLLFLCAGSVQHGTGTVSLRLLGGLQKRLPVVGCCFVLGAAAITALPPLNGFAGEFLIYLGLTFGGSIVAQGMANEYSLIFWFALAALAAISGFALLCFVRMYAITFLGQARSPVVANAHTPARTETAVLLGMAGLCLVSALAAPQVARQCRSALPHLGPAAVYTGAPQITAAPAQSRILTHTNKRIAPRSNFIAVPHINVHGPEYTSAFALLKQINQGFLACIIFVAALFLLRRRLLRGRDIGVSPTWSCGYIAPTSRMQYTGGAFSQPAGRYMRNMLRPKISLPVINEYFPVRARASMSAPDWVTEEGFIPFFRATVRLADWCKGMQHGRVNGYILYILITLVVLLAWELG